MSEDRPDRRPGRRRAQGNADLRVGQKLLLGDYELYFVKAYNLGKIKVFWRHLPIDPSIAQSRHVVE